MGLPGRLALLTAAMAVLLVLGATEISLALSARQRLEDYRTESVALAQTWAAYLTRLAPSGDRSALTEGLDAWPGQHIAATAATAFVAENGILHVAAASDDSAQVAPLGYDYLALRQRSDQVWRDTGDEPAWQVAAVLGGAQPYGVLRVTVSTLQLRRWAQTERRRAYLAAALAALLLSTGVGLLTARWVGRPLKELGLAMAQAHGGVEGAPSAKEIGSEEFRVVARRYNALRDALAARERESDARAALLALEERARMLDRLALSEETAAAFAHEIGTPLNTVSGHLQLLRDDLNGAAPRGVVERVQLLLAQVSRVVAIVRNRLEGSAWPEPETQDTDLAAVAERMLRFLEPTFANARVSAGVEGVADVVIARGDPQLVEQILLNLLKNAVEALAPGGRITIRVGIDSRHAWLEVADTGPGLAADARRHLFEPFATTKGRGGTGLGLAVSRRLARASGGDLEHQPSSLGTVWRLTLPLGVPAHV